MAAKDAHDTPRLAKLSTLRLSFRIAGSSPIISPFSLNLFQQPQCGQRKLLELDPALALEKPPNKGDDGVDEATVLRQ